VFLHQPVLQKVHQLVPLFHPVSHYLLALRSLLVPLSQSVSLPLHLHPRVYQLARAKVCLKVHRYLQVVPGLLVVPLGPCLLVLLSHQASLLVSRCHPQSLYLYHLLHRSVLVKVLALHHPRVSQFLPVSLQVRVVLRVLQRVPQYHFLSVRVLQ